MWNKCSEKKPAQGKKVLCMHKGDFYVAQRFKDVYVPIPLSTSILARDLIHPEFWMDILFMEPFKGFMYVMKGGECRTIDEMEKYFPEDYEELCAAIIGTVGNLNHEYQLRDM